MFTLRCLLFACVTVGASAVQTFSAAPSFEIDYSGDTFLRDGQPFRFVAGSIHYFRVPRAYWPDRLRRLRAMGANAVQTYVEWNTHEREQEQYNFEGDNDLVEFIAEAQRQDLVVLLRTGPFMDAEREMGGLPYWLLTVNPQMKMRSSDADYLRLVDRWLDQLLPRLKPMMYDNGGPIIMVQVENEYGSFGACDAAYLQHLVDKLRQGLGASTVLYTTDGDGTSYLKCGTTPDAYATIDFGPGTDIKKAFDVQRTKSPHGPLVNSEYYPGWLDHWGYPHSTRSASSVSKTLDDMLAYGANVNVYMAHGGTSFGWGAGSNGGGAQFQVCPTSYDYDAPISEYGYLSEKYFVMRNTTLKYMTEVSVPEPPPQPEVRAYGTVSMTASASLLSAVEMLDMVNVASDVPMTFEELQNGYGFVLYTHQVSGSYSATAVLDLSGVRDRGYVFVDGTLAGIVSREEQSFSLPVSVEDGSLLQILVENRGRICFGGAINDIKGLLSAPKLDNKILNGWKHKPLPLNSTQLPAFEHFLEDRTLTSSQKLPAFFTGMFDLPSSVNAATPPDTFLRLDGWVRGVAFINGFNLGRYWPLEGPQVTLYVPGPLLKARNNITLLELEGAPCGAADTCQVTFTDTHVIDGPTPHSHRTKERV